MRFQATMVSAPGFECTASDAQRKFMVSFFLEDSTLSIAEPPNTVTRTGADAAGTCPSANISISPCAWTRGLGTQPHGHGICAAMRRLSLGMVVHQRLPAAPKFGWSTHEQSQQSIRPVCCASGCGHSQLQGRLAGSVSAVCLACPPAASSRIPRKCQCSDWLPTPRKAPRYPDTNTSGPNICVWSGQGHETLLPARRILQRSAPACCSSQT